MVAYNTYYSMVLKKGGAYGYGQKYPKGESAIAYVSTVTVYRPTVGQTYGYQGKQNCLLTSLENHERLQCLQSPLEFC